MNANCRTRIFGTGTSAIPGLSKPIKQAFALGCIPLIAVLVLLLATPANSQEQSPSIDERLDKWFASWDATQGNNPTSYWPTELALDEAFGTDRTPTAKKILSKIKDGYSAWERGTSGAAKCPNTVRDTAISYVIDRERFDDPELKKLLLKRLADLLQLPRKAVSSAASAAQDAVQDQFRKYLQKRAKKATEKTAKNIARVLANPGRPEVMEFSNSWTSGVANRCDIGMGVIWDKTLKQGSSQVFYQTYRFIVMADCKCECNSDGKVKREPVMPEKFVSGGTGRVVIRVRNDRISFNPGTPIIWAHYKCCGFERSRKRGPVPADIYQGAENAENRENETKEEPESEADKKARETEKTDPKSIEISKRISDYKRKISNAKTIEELEEILDEVTGEMRGFEKQADLMPDGSPSKEAAKKNAAALDELMRTGFDKKAEELDNSGAFRSTSDQETNDQQLAYFNSQNVAEEQKRSELSREVERRGLLKIEVDSQQELKIQDLPVALESQKNVCEVY